MENQTITLNDYLTEKGITTNLKHKRQLAKTFGIEMDKGTAEEESALLLALKVGSMATASNIKETYRVEIASFEGEEKPIDCNNLAEVDTTVRELFGKGKKCRTAHVITLTQIL